MDDEDAEEPPAGSEETGEAFGPAPPPAAPGEPRNRRRGLRAPVDLPVAFRDVRAGVTHLATAVDLSAAGMSIRSPIRLGRWSPVYVVVGHESLGLHFESKSRVARWHREGDAFVLSLRFCSLPPDVAAEIGRYVVRELAAGTRSGVTAA